MESKNNRRGLAESALASHGVVCSLLLRMMVITCFGCGAATQDMPGEGHLGDDHLGDDHLGDDHLGDKQSLGNRSSAMPRESADVNRDVNGGLTALAAEPGFSAAESLTVSPAGLSSPPGLTIRDPVAAAEPAVTMGLTSPVLQSAEEADMSEEALVIGIVVNGQPRAYAIDAITSQASGIVNDVIRKTPVSITYCPDNGMARVFAGTNSDKPMQLARISQSAAGMSLVLNGLRWEQTSDSIPLEDVDFVQTVWIAWKSEHPETDVFTGTQP